MSELLSLRCWYLFDCGGREHLHQLLGGPVRFFPGLGGVHKLWGRHLLVCDWSICMLKLRWGYKLRCRGISMHQLRCWTVRRFGFFVQQLCLEHLHSSCRRFRLHFLRSGLYHLIDRLDDVHGVSFGSVPRFNRTSIMYKLSKWPVSGVDNAVNLFELHTR